VLNAPEAKQIKGRDEYCPPYKTARWEEFLVFVLGAKVGKSLMGGAENGAASPIRSMQELPASNVYSPRTRPPAPSSPPTSPPRSPRGAGRSTKAAAAGTRTADGGAAPPTSTAVVINETSNLDYAALAAMGVLLAVVAVGCSKDAMATVDSELNKLVRRK
jgi:hypothetical protein